MTPSDDHWTSTSTLSRSIHSEIDISVITTDPGINDGTVDSARIVLSEDDIKRNFPDLVLWLPSLLSVIVTKTRLPGEGFSGLKIASNLMDDARVSRMKIEKRP